CPVMGAMDFVFLTASILFWFWMSVFTLFVILKPKQFNSSRRLKVIVVSLSMGPAIIATAVFWISGFFGASIYSLCWVSSDPPSLLMWLYNFPTFVLAVVACGFLLASVIVCHRMLKQDSKGMHSHQTSAALKMAYRTLPFTLSLVMFQICDGLLDMQPLFHYSLPIWLVNTLLILSASRGVVSSLCWAIPTYYLDVIEGRRLQRQRDRPPVGEVQRHPPGREQTMTV
ncbi:hypothetical protein KIPB_009528, partial [Kipferlia bialata]